MTQASPTNNLPATLTSFIGRERDLDNLAGLIVAGAARLVTLTGAGGCGKTRLAISLAERLTAGGVFEHGVWLAELAGLNSPDLVGQTVAAAPGLPEAQDQPILGALSQYLHPKAVLLLLDNCEHLLPACTDLARAVLEAAPHVRILATSREPLGLPGAVESMKFKLYKDGESGCGSNPAADGPLSIFASVHHRAPGHSRAGNHGTRATPGQRLSHLTVG
jgi:hypothetical protein